MRAVVLQHADFETAGAAAGWLESKDADVITVKLYEEGFTFPDISEIDLLIILGGPMNLDQEDQYPWLKPEKEFVRTVLHAGVPTLGICLGAQHISLALGGEVTQNPETEIGWFPVRGIPAGPDLYQMPEKQIFLEWHGQTYSLPDGATNLAYSDACKNQAFQWTDRVIGVQFHPEYTPELVQDTIAELTGDLEVSKYVQSAETISSAPHKYYEGAHRFLFNVLDYLVRDLDEAPSR